MLSFGSVGCAHVDCAQQCVCVGAQELCAQQFVPRLTWGSSGGFERGVHPCSVEKQELCATQEQEEGAKGCCLHGGLVARGAARGVWVGGAEGEVQHQSWGVGCSVCLVGGGVTGSSSRQEASLEGSSLRVWLCWLAHQFERCWCRVRALEVELW